MDPVFAEIADALRAGDVTDRIEGLVASPGFARLTDPTRGQTARGGRCANLISLA